MPLNKLQFKPGINTEVTAYTNEGGWNDCDKVRFRFGFPEKIGGWEKYSQDTILGTCRSLHAWRAVDNSRYMGVGTNIKFYIEEGETFFDVTPLRKTTTNSTTFSASNGSATITVTDAGHGSIVGDFVTFSDAVSLGGNITAAVLNQEYEIQTVPSTNTYTITATATANSSDTGNGGGSVTSEYQINVGTNAVVPGTGWGAGTWGRGTWGSAATTTAGGESIRIWSQDNFGEDLIINLRDAGIYYWDKTLGTGARVVDITTLDSNAPTVSRQVIVSDRDRHVIAFGCNALGSADQDKLLVRFSDQESATTWEPTATNTAGDLVVGSGSEIIQAVETRREIVIFTDASTHSMQFIGPPFTFGINQLAANTTIMGANAAVAVNDSVFWMGKNRFYVYDGQVQDLPCTVRDTVFDDFNETQSDKVFAGVNSEFGEVIWFYSSAESDNNDKYVIYNYDEKVWYFGNLQRSAWLDRGLKSNPIAASSSSQYLFNHEIGADDDGSALAAHIESSPIDISEGESFGFIRRLIPDISFLTTPDTASKEVTFTLKAEDFPGTGFTQNYASTVTADDTQNHVRIRGRGLGLRIESANQGVTWRLGSPRVDIRQDGRR
jgi:hypothetical protein